MTEEKETQDSSEGVLVAAAKTIGTTAGTIAAAVGLTTSRPVKTAKKKAPPLPKKNKARLPRKQKKAARKATKSE